MIDYLVDLQKLCANFQQQWTNNKKIAYSLSDFLLFDYFLKEWTDSNFHLSDLLKDDVLLSSTTSEPDPWDMRGANYLI